jgi:hypothetical protein
MSKRFAEIFAVWIRYINQGILLPRHEEAGDAGEEPNLQLWVQSLDGADRSGEVSASLHQNIDI